MSLLQKLQCGGIGVCDECYHRRCFVCLRLVFGFLAGLLDMYPYSLQDEKEQEHPNPSSQKGNVLDES